METSYWGETGLGQRTGVVRVSGSAHSTVKTAIWVLGAVLLLPTIYFNSLYPSGLLITAVNACVRESPPEIWEY